MASCAPEYGSVNATCTCVAPGANGPAITSFVPATLPCGDEPCMIVAPCAPSGRSIVTGMGGATGAAVLFTTCRM